MIKKIRFGDLSFVMKAAVVWAYITMCSYAIFGAAFIVGFLKVLI